MPSTKPDLTSTERIFNLLAAMKLTGSVELPVALGVLTDEKFVPVETVTHKFNVSFLSGTLFALDAKGIVFPCTKTETVTALGFLLAEQWYFERLIKPLSIVPSTGTTITVQDFYYPVYLPKS